MADRDVTGAIRSGAGGDPRAAGAGGPATDVRVRAEPEDLVREEVAT